MVDILNGKYADAASKLNGANSFNEALVNILNGNLSAASNILADAQCQCKNYLKAIIAARQGDVEAAKAALEIASKDEALAARAENDIEFAADVKKKFRWFKTIGTFFILTGRIIC